jgi:hypothetical protein
VAEVAALDPGAVQECSVQAAGILDREHLFTPATTACRRETVTSSKDVAVR